MPQLDDKQLRALQLGNDLRSAIQQWLRYRGADQSFAVSPYVDGTGEPAVLIRMNAHVAAIMIDSLRAAGQMHRR